MHFLDESFGLRRMARMTSSEVNRQFGHSMDVAQREPVEITSHGRVRTVMISAEEYRRLKSLDQQALSVAELTETELAHLSKAEPPAASHEFDYETG